MRAAFKPWTLLTYHDGAGQEYDPPLPPIGSTLLEGTWLPVLPQTDAETPTPDAILAEVILVDMTSAVEHHATSALTANISIYLIGIQIKKHILYI